MRVAILNLRFESAVIAIAAIAIAIFWEKERKIEIERERETERRNKIKERKKKDRQTRSRWKCMKLRWIYGGRDVPICKEFLQRNLLSIPQRARILRKKKQSRLNA